MEFNSEENIKEEQQIKKEYTTNSDRTKGPYYDLKDIHIHQWSRGNIVPQNSHSKILSFDKKQNNVLFCIICHEIKLEQSINVGTKITSVYNIENIVSTKDKVQVDNSFEKSMSFIDNTNLNLSMLQKENSHGSSNKHSAYNNSHSNKIKNIDILGSKLFITNEHKENNEEIVVFRTY